MRLSSKMKKPVMVLRLGLLVALAIMLTLSVGVSFAGQSKVTVCHKPGTPAEMTLEIAAPAEAAHLAHGDTQGECTGPQSDGCATLNAVVPDPQTDLFSYIFAITGLDLLPGETIHIDMTVTAFGKTSSEVASLDSAFQPLAVNSLSLSAGKQGTVSVDYVVVAGDDFDAAAATVTSLGFTLDDINFSCTPA